MKHIRILILCIAFALLTGCAPAAQDTAAYAPDESERLVLYTSHKKEVWWPIVKEFESRTGIWVEVVQGGTNELLEQLQKGAGRTTGRRDVRRRRRESRSLPGVV